MTYWLACALLLPATATAPWHPTRCIELLAAAAVLALLHIADELHTIRRNQEKR